MSHLSKTAITMGHEYQGGVAKIQKTKGGAWTDATPSDLEDYKDAYARAADPRGALRKQLDETERGPLPAGKYWSEDEAKAAAELSGLRGSQPIGTYPEGGVIWSTSEYRTYVKAGVWSFEEASDPIEDASIERFTYKIDPGTGNLIRLSNIDPNRKDVVEEAPDKPDAGSTKIGNPIPTGFGYSLQMYEVTDSSGATSRYQVKIKDVDDREIGVDSDIDLGEGRGDFVYLGDGKYEHVPDPKTPFTTKASDVVPLPEQGGSLIKISENQYQFVRDTFDPGRKVDETGREYLQQIDGSWSELDPRFDPELIRADGMNLFQQRSGDVDQLTPPNMDDIITQALIDGDVDKALAFQDFRDRPTAQEAFQTALDFARSPADQRIISAIARGITPVQPPPEGTIQRVGPQPDFLVQAYEDFQRRTQAGRAPTGEEIAGASEDPTLQARLESIANKDRREEEKHQLFITTQTNSERRTQESFEAQESRKNTESAARVATSTAATASAGDDDDPGVDVRGTPPPPGTTRLIGGPASDYGVRDIPNESVEQFLRSGFWKVYTEEMEAEAEAARPSTILWESFSQPQKDLFGSREEFGDMTERDANFHLRSHGLLDPVEPDADESDAVQLNIPTEAPSLFEQRAPARAEIDAALDIIGRGKDPGAGMPITPAGKSGSTNSMFVPPTTLAGYAPGTTFADIEGALGLGERATNIAPVGEEASDPFALRGRAGGGIVGNREMTVVGENGPEIAMMPPGTHILPLGKATKQDIRAAQSTGRAYQTGGIVFGDLPIGLQQLQRGRPITPPRGYLFQQGGLTMPSAQALQNLTPGTRESFYGMAGDIGISPAEFRQELQTATPRGTRLPTSRMLPLGRRGVR